METLTDRKISNHYESGKQDLESLIAPLIELSEESSSLVVGYGLGQSASREQMIPYFHVCGSYTDQAPVRVLLIGGWAGTESVTPYVAARVVAALESKLRLVAGIEITAYPVANLDAHRTGEYVTRDQQNDSAKCWEDSSLNHIKVLENELKRYDFDLVIVLRENLRAHEAQVEAWLVEDEQKSVLSAALDNLASVGHSFAWKPNPVRPVYPRSFTPIPNADRQPAEIIIGLPGARDTYDQSQEGLGLILSLAHAVRQARNEGRL